MAGCGENTQVGMVEITPASQSLTAGQTAQFSATGVISHGQHPATTVDVTGLVTWTSSSTDIATISSSGVATAVSAGSATITASLSGAASATATITVTGGGGGKGGNGIVSLAIIPGAQSVATPSETSQFIAIGTTASGTTEDLTGQVSWTSSSANVATINGGGLATAVGQGTATITAIATNSDKSVATGTATFTVTSGTQEPITALIITPTSESLSASGQQGQFIAIGTAGTSGLTQDVTNSSHLRWISSVPSVASITSGGASGNGEAKGVSAGTTNITAVWTNPDGSIVTSPTATIAVSLIGRAQSAALPHPHSRCDFRWRSAGHRPIPGHWNVFDRAVRSRCNQLPQHHLDLVLPGFVPRRHQQWRDFERQRRHCHRLRHRQRHHYCRIPGPVHPDHPDRGRNLQLSSCFAQPAHDGRILLHGPGGTAQAPR